MNDLTFSAILIGAAFIAGLVIYQILILLGKWAQRKKVKANLDIIKKPLRFLIPPLCIAIILPFSKLPENLLPTLGHFINIFVLMLFTWLGINIISIIRDVILGHYDISARDNLKARGIYTQVRVIHHIIVFVIILLTVSFILMTFPKVKQVGVSLLASAGIIGIVIGFAAQKTLGNLIAGIQIALAQPIRLDDVVIVENEWGWIEEITLTYVVVRIWDLRRLVIPISHFIEKPFQNWTRISADILGSVFIYADYTVPVKEMRSELTRILEKSPHWDKKVNVLQVTNATAQTIEIRALMSAADSPTAWNLRCEVREKLLEFLQKSFPECLPRTRIELKEKLVPK
ncbi:MAG: mechanosensitive ion channel [Candidatus Ratteibacteria bacterium]|nr:mechanosensitive ion channel [Candidatus Ratteibacteria bacterium]